jgi:hypothetical protein
MYSWREYGAPQVKKLDMVNGQLQYEAALYPWNEAPVPRGRECGWAPEQFITWRREKYLPLPSNGVSSSILDFMLVGVLQRSTCSMCVYESNMTVVLHHINFHLFEFCDKEILIQSQGLYP